MLEPPALPERPETHPIYRVGNANYTRKLGTPIGPHKTHSPTHHKGKAGENWLVENRWLVDATCWLVRESVLHKAVDIRISIGLQIVKEPYQINKCQEVKNNRKF